MATEDIGNVRQILVEDEMRSSYLDYAMSVITARALPDVRDGLKPSQRRILVAMHDLNLAPNRGYRKCAKIASDTSGNYHPHGEAVVYPTLVRLAQPFNMRYPLVDGQGNFGSVDGDPPAAMRYTEARLTPLAMEMLADLDMDTVDLVPNYDGTRDEPSVLPARFPNLLCNGSSGIAVGMATNIPPHNLGEVIDACTALIDDPDITLEGLMEHVKGPDFPTRGIVMGTSGVRDAYETGRGRIRVRAVAHIEPQKGGHDAIVVTLLPYQVRKGGEDGVIAKIAQLASDKVIPGIRNVLDQSDKSGMRIWIELRRDQVAKVVLNNLYKHTPLQTTFGANMVALVDGVPRTLGLKAMLRHYVDHQREVITRRTKSRLERAERRAHILEGFLIALDTLDAVIELIRGSRDAEEARGGLIREFGLSEDQAVAILDMRLQRLTGLAQDEIRSEHAERVETITELRAILADEQRVLSLIKDELLEVRERYAD